MAKFTLKKAYESRLKLDRKQQKAIRLLYFSLVQTVREEIKSLEGSEMASDKIQYESLSRLEKELDSAMWNVGSAINFLIRNNMYTIANEIVEDNKDFLLSTGFKKGFVKGAFENVPSQIVESVATGQVYDGKWSLSKRIWADVNKKQDDINKIVARGIAQNKSAFDIAKDLEKYVDPRAAKPWDWSIVYPGTAKKIDYNAQRLARTMVSHAYQQAFDETTKPNPFVKAVKWNNAHAAREGVPCEICEKRATEDHFGLGPGVYKKGTEPLDHPNGMCFLTAVSEDTSLSADRIARWRKGESDPELDAFAKKLNPKWDFAKESPVSDKGVDKSAGSGIIKTNKAKNIDIFNDSDLKPGDPTPAEILNELSQSAIGREISELLPELPEAIALMHGNVPDLRGEECGGRIKIYVNQCRNIQWVARTIIHEYTHYRYGIGYSQWSECVCIAQELKHSRNRDYLTISEKRMIIKAVKNDCDYRRLNWKKGGFINGRRKDYR